MIKPLIILTLLLFLLHLPAFTQKGGVKLICSPRKDSILLRWAPVDQKTWKLGNQMGYTILRYTLLKGKKIPKEIIATHLTPVPLKPHPMNEWQALADDKYVAIAGECLFNDVYHGVNISSNPFLALKKYKNDLHRFSFALFAADQSLKAAELSGLYFADKTTLPDEKYLYKIFIPNHDSTLRLDTASAFTGMSEFQPLPKPLDFKAEWGNKSVSLSWNFKFLNHIYNSYQVEKSDDGGKNYKPANESAVVQFSDEGVSPDLIYKSDSLENNDHKYYYRIRGISAFGEIGPPSDTVAGTGIKPMVMAPTIIENTVIENKKIKLSWIYPADMNRYIGGFRIYSSTKPKGRKKKIYESKTSSERLFTDENPDITNYYLISVFNASKEKFSSITTYSELVDSVPPLPPRNISGTIDTTGKVILSWIPNTDKDLDGYRVYTSNHPDFEYILKTSAVIRDTFYIDTINIKTLTPDIYYKIKAVDLRQNQSAFSAQLKLKRPDVIPPVSPVIKDLTEQNGGILLSWVNSSSDDVAFHHIYRKEKHDTVYQEIAKLTKVPDIRSTYLDKKVKSGKEYFYLIKAEDEHRLYSKPSKSEACKTTASKESITLKKQEQTDNVKLTWIVKSDKIVDKVLIYRSMNGSDLTLYDNAGKESYTDTKINPEKNYTYRVKVIYTDGSSSELSNLVKVKK